MVAQPPLRRYQTEQPAYCWPVVQRPMDSPAKDGTVAYYQDSLSWGYGGPLDGELEMEVGFDPNIARALCQYLKSLAVARSLEISDGPYLQILEDDGSVPPGWVMLRALVWVDEYDMITPLDDEAVKADGCQLIAPGGAYVERTNG